MVPSKAHLCGGMVPSKAHLCGGMVPSKAHLCGGMVPSKAHLCGGMVPSKAHLCGGMVPSKAHLCGGMVPSKAHLCGGMVPSKAHLCGGMVPSKAHLCGGMVPSKAHLCGGMVPSKAHLCGGMVPSKAHLCGGMVPSKAHLCGGMLPSKAHLCGGMVPSKAHLCGGMLPSKAHLCGGMVPSKAHLCGGMLPSKAHLCGGMVPGRECRPYGPPPFKFFSQFTTGTQGIIKGLSLRMGHSAGESRSSPLFICILLDPGTVVDCICINLIELYYELDSGIREDFIWTDHLSPQLQRNQQILLHNGPRVDCRPRNKRRRVLGDVGVHASTASQLLRGSSLKKACRNLSLEFCTAEELAHTPPVDSWVLQTLGLKDVDTIDHSANYSNLLTSLDDHNALHADSGVGVEGSPCSLDTRYLSPLSSSSPQAQSTPLPSSATPSPFKSPYSVDVSRNKTEVAFTMSLNPHCNVKTHSFDQGQAFVCRDEHAGWKFTWVPKQLE
ncbi:UNVERIFIED_CONTAM: hypothetical protein FKN15_021188 [Acipenser sinensis]